MRLAIVGIVVAGQLAWTAHAAPSPADACVRAAAMAEQRWALPANLLLAIGRIETGRRDDTTGQVQPWPWSANAVGFGYTFESLPEARAVVGFLRGRGIDSIDIGCFQVNLHHHPDAFASIEAGFDPYVNADYAARFLRSLFDRSGNWETAIGAYHSGDPQEGSTYRAKVLRAWQGIRAGVPVPSPFAVRDPHVVYLAEPRSQIPVYTPRTLPSALRPAYGLAPAARAQN